MRSILDLEVVWMTLKATGPEDSQGEYRWGWLWIWGNALEHFKSLGSNWWKKILKRHTLGMVGSLKTVSMWTPEEAGVM